MGSKQRHFYEFGRFRLDVDEGFLLRDGEVVPLTRKAFELLMALVEDSGHVFTKEELLKRVWPDSFVEEANLSRHVYALREALGESQSEQKFIETVPRRGYRFVAPVREIHDEGEDVLLAEHTTARIVAEEIDKDPAPAALPAALLPAPKNHFGRLAVVIAATAIAAAVIAIYFGHKRVQAVMSAAPLRSIAVLPFKPLTADTRDESLELGMADTLIAKLGGLRGVVVRPTSAVRQYAESRQDALATGRELKVDSVLEGNIQRQNDRLRITIRLLRVDNGEQIWSAQFNEEARDIFAVQDSISQQVAAALAPKISTEECEAVDTRITESPKAYDQYLRGRFHNDRENKSDNDAAVAALESAVASDPNFAAAYAELARAYHIRRFWLVPQETELEEKGYVAVEKALSLDPDLAPAHFARALLSWTPANHFPSERAIREYQRAIELNPNYDEAHHQLGLLYAHIGLLEKGEAEIRRALEINPNNTLAQSRVAVVYLYQGKYEEALAIIQRIPRQFNPSGLGYQHSWCLLNLGRREEAMAVAEDYLKASPDDPGGVVNSTEAMIFAANGDAARAEQKIKLAIELGKGFGHFHHTAYNIGCAYALMNRQAEALSWLQTASDNGLPAYPLYAMDHNLDHLRQNQGFIAFMNKLHVQWETYAATL